MDKIAVRVNPLFSEALQNVAFKKGYVWEADDQTSIMYTNEPLILFNKQKRKIFRTAYEKVEDGLKECRISGYEIISTIQEIVDFLIDEPIKLGDYTGEISKGGLSVKVECQTVTFDQVENLYNKMKEAQNV